MAKLVTFNLSTDPQEKSQDDFETFTENLESNLENLVQKNPFLVVAIGDFNAKSSNGFVKIKLALKEMQLKFNIPVWIAPGD